MQSGYEAKFTEYTAGLYLTDYFPPPTLVVVTFAHAVDIGKCNNENLAM